MRAFFCLNSMPTASALERMQGYGCYTAMPLGAMTRRGTIDVAFRIKNYVRSIMREA
jgi:hypothetical protein